MQCTTGAAIQHATCPINNRRSGKESCAVLPWTAAVYPAEHVFVAFSMRKHTVSFRSLPETDTSAGEISMIGQTSPSRPESARIRRHIRIGCSFNDQLSSLTTINASNSKLSIATTAQIIPIDASQLRNDGSATGIDNQERCQPTHQAAQPPLRKLLKRGTQGSLPVTGAADHQ